MTPSSGWCSLRCKFVSFTVLCVIFVVLTIIYWHGDRDVSFRFAFFDDESVYMPENGSLMFKPHTIFNFTGNWTPIYSLADRLAMPKQPVPGLAGGFKPTCALDAPCITVGSGWFGDFKSWEFFARSFYPAGCDLRCHFVSDVSQADAVVFHGRDLSPIPPTWKRHPRQLWLYLNLESPRATKSYGLNVAKHKVYHRLFNLTSTYQPESFARTTYGYTEARAIPVQPRLPDLSLKKRLAYIAFSNCWGTFNARPTVVRRLQSVMQLDVYGGCGKLQLPRTPDAFQQLGKQYYFYLSFENAFCRDYITEKLYANALATDAAPVAIGGFSRADYEAAAPPNSFVYGPDFKTARDLASHLRRLAADSKAYLALFAWRANYQVKGDNLLCGTCRAMYDIAARNPSTTPVRAHLGTYYDVDKNCQPTSKHYLI